MKVYLALTSHRYVFSRCHPASRIIRVLLWRIWYYRVTCGLVGYGIPYSRPMMRGSTSRRRVCTSCTSFEHSLHPSLWEHYTSGNTWSNPNRREFQVPWNRPDLLWRASWSSPRRWGPCARHSCNWNKSRNRRWDNGHWLGRISPSDRCCRRFRNLLGGTTYDSGPCRPRG